jgi:hypothetical protein
MRALRRFTPKAPNPRSSTRPPRARVSVIWSNIVVTISSTSAARRCGLLAASSAMRSDLVNVAPCCGDYRLGSCACSAEPLDEGAVEVGGCQFLGRMVMSRHTVPRTCSVLLPPGSVTRQQSSRGGGPP